jgi:hypothetical protein
MTDLREPTSPSTPSQSVVPASPDDAADPLHNLYRMSRTAGLGSGDYVAINNTSILALILGLAGVLSMLYPLLLIISAAALVCGIMALLQIRSSNGTQSGRTFAILGILLALGLGGLAGAKLALAGIETHREEAAIDDLVQRLSGLLVARKYDEAYQSCFSVGFKGQFTQQEFVDRWRPFERYAGGIKSFDWGKHADIQETRGSDVKRAAAGSLLKFNDSSNVATQGIGFVKENGQWHIDGIQSLFEKEANGRGGGGGGGQPDPRVPQGPAPSFPLPGTPGAPPTGPAAPQPAIPRD